MLQGDPSAAAPRTPLRNISNAGGASPGRPNNVAVMMHKKVLALRAGAAPRGGSAAMQQVSGQKVHLATSPMQTARVGGLHGAVMRSPMAGRTPEDMKRAVKRMQAPANAMVLPTSLSPFRPAGLQQQQLLLQPQPQPQPQPMFDQQFVQRLPFVAASLAAAGAVEGAGAPTASQQTASEQVLLRQLLARAVGIAGWKEYKTPEGKPYYHHASSQTTQWEAPAGWGSAPAAVAAVVDPAVEEARIKKAEAKAKREAKAALKAQQEALRHEEEQRAAEGRAAVLALKNAAVVEAIANVDAEEGCDLELIEPVDTVPWQVVAIGQSLRVLVDQKVSLHPMSLRQIQDVLRARKPTLETENMLAALHSPLLEAARGNTQGAAKMSSTSSWMAQVKKWAHEELGARSPFHDKSVASNKKDGSLEYKRLPYASRLSLLHDLSCAAITGVLSRKDGAADTDDQQCASALQPQPLGQDAKGRTYWLGADTSGAPSAWVLRERGTAREPGRSRLSVLSSEGTPLKDRCMDLGSPVVGGGIGAEGRVGAEEQDEDEQDLEGPERGEAGDNFYWHQHWVAVMARASRPTFWEAEDEEPHMDLLAADADMVRTLVKALWSGGCECEAELARTLVAQVLTPLVQEPATSIKGALRKQPSRSSRAAAKAKASAVLVSA